jgi:hypothetical protein
VYLRDELENEDIIIQSEQVSDDELEIRITDKTTTEETKSVKEFYLTDLSLSETQAVVLNFFAKNNLVIAIDDFKMYAKENGWFAKQVIESINDYCYEFLDDILIEEEEDYYTITEDYYQNILTQ